MVRAFLAEPLPTALVDELVDLARRAPAAGNTQGVAFLVLDQPPDVARYWDTTLPEARRAAFPWPGLLAAPVLVVPCVRAAAYVARYREADKASTGLGAGTEQWAVPYWHVDGGMAVAQLLLLADDAGLGALLFGIFEHEPAVRAAFGIPDDWQPLGTVALGRPAGRQRPSRSAARARRPLAEILHRRRWPPSAGAE
ncbi:MAG: nitroreductase family protein [Acidimicrobiia bacterium]|nr:nitroreductase family protein [Acidimicrobiia bacterium]